MILSVKSFVIMVLSLLSLVSCAGIDDVDRTQPGKLKKSANEGEWYYRQTVVDVPFTAGMTFIGEQSILVRMRWEIREDRLTAYRSYERVQDSEAPRFPGTAHQGARLLRSASLTLMSSGFTTRPRASVQRYR